MNTISLWPFLLTVVTISLSGVMMPGPVTAVTVAAGAKSPHAGAWVAIGHGVIEFPLMALIYFGAGAWFERVPVKIGVGLAGGLVLLRMGYGVLRDYRQGDLPPVAPEAQARSPFLSGILLSAGNPYFLIWWATAGAVLIGKSWAFGLFGFIVMALVHWSCDFGWLYFLSALSFRGGRFFGRKLEQGLLIACGLCLLFFAGYFLAGSFLMLANHQARP